MDTLEIKIQVASLIQEMKDVGRRISSLEDKIDDKLVTHDKHNNLDERVRSIESTITWLYRTIVGALILAGLTVIGLGKKTGIL